MIVTQIKKQKKNPSRYSIFLDGEFAFGLYDDTILKYGLKSGDNLASNLIEKIRIEDELIFGKRIIYKYLSRRARTIKEVETKLTQLEVSRKTVNEVIDYFLETGYLNDVKFTKEFIETKIRRKPTGSKLIQIKLKQKGVKEETIDEVIGEVYTQNQELEKALEAAQKYISRNRAIAADNFTMQSRLYRYLVSRGFQSDTILEVIKEFN
ncbi:MAG: regulatory protein RecX [Chlorobi bacterium OLB4]|jgi:Uncharacterized protein conserved in bacteria|nr:MAG: regulatory protein RecX [Chlorobi bacterium OLB4]MBW7856430.1 RecX family transcriptional regulator [Ignavibacteria bacterium]OQY78717.1 MAG: hypothetical protein B6D43_01690 [Ignavibacteriales bacterium UTCHB1]